MEVIMSLFAAFLVFSFCIFIGVIIGEFLDDLNNKMR